MRRSRIKSKLAKNEPVLIPTLHLVDASLFEMTSLMGFDGIWMDMEHHPYSVETAAHLMRAARIGSSDIMVRPAKQEFMRMARLLEIGAQGIMYPRCDDAQEAAEVVRWAKFAPLGTRGFDGAGADTPYCALPMAEYTQAANAQTFIVIQLEDAAAVEQADAIASVPGVDVLFFGPADFSVLNGIPGQFDHPLINSAIKKVAEGARRAGKHWGMPTWNPGHTHQLMEMGARFFCCSADIILVKTGFEQLQKNYSAAGFAFDNQMMAEAKSYLEEQ